MGGYIAADRKIIDCIRSYAPGFIFTTSLSPVLVAGALASVRHLKASSAEREAQQQAAAMLKAKFAAAGLPLMPSVTHIVPLLVGCPVKAKRISDILLAEYGLYVQPINYPTVPRGTERLRFTPGPCHTAEMMDELTARPGRDLGPRGDPAGRLRLANPLRLRLRQSPCASPSPPTMPAIVLKDELAAWLREQGHEVIDLGTNGPESVDYPEYGAQARRGDRRRPGRARDRRVRLGNRHLDRRQPQPGLPLRPGRRPAVGRAGARA